MGTFVGGLAARRRRSRGCSTATRASTTRSTSPCSALATFKAARTISRDEVTSFIREPFVEGEAHTTATRSRSRRATSARRSASSSPARAASAPGSPAASRRPRSSRRASAASSPGRSRRPARTTGSRRGSPALTSKANELERAPAALTTRPAPRLPCGACAAWLLAAGAALVVAAPAHAATLNVAPSLFSPLRARLQVSAKLSVPRQVGVSLVNRQRPRARLDRAAVAAHDPRDRLERPHARQARARRVATASGSSTARACSRPRRCGSTRRRPT